MYHIFWTYSSHTVNTDLPNTYLIIYHTFWTLFVLHGHHRPTDHIFCHTLHTINPSLVYISSLLFPVIVLPHHSQVKSLGQTDNGTKEQSVNNMSGQNGHKSMAKTTAATRTGQPSGRNGQHVGHKSPPKSTLKFRNYY